jgi:hypothetical protein
MNKILHSIDYMTQSLDEYDAHMLISFVNTSSILSSVCVAQP